jgi:hypothetical protein
MNQSGGGPAASQGADNAVARREFAAALRRARNTIGQEVAQSLGARWRSNDVGTDLTSGVVAEECQRLVTTLAFAIEMDDATLFCDEIGWLDRMFRIRGYDGARFLPRIFDAYEAACRALGSAESVQVYVTPVLDAARQCIAAVGSGDAG